MIYTVKRGATLVVPLEAVGAVDADLAIVALIDAGLKRTRNGAIPADTAPRDATFAISFRPAAGGVGPGWNLMLTDEETAELEPGTYATDAELHLQGGTVVVTDPLFIRIEQTVSA